MPPPSPLITDMLAMRARHQAYARRLATEIEKRARQVTLEVTRGRSVATLLLEMADCGQRLRDEQRAMDLIDEWAARMKRAAA